MSSEARTLSAAPAPAHTRARPTTRARPAAEVLAPADAVRQLRVAAPAQLGLHGLVAGSVRLGRHDALLAHDRQLGTRRYGRALAAVREAFRNCGGHRAGRCSCASAPRKTARTGGGQRGAGARGSHGRQHAYGAQASDTRQCVKLLNLSAFLRRWALKLLNFAPALRAEGSKTSCSARRLWRLPSALRRLAPIALHLAAASDLRTHGRLSWSAAQPCRAGSVCGWHRHALGSWPFAARRG